MMANAPSCLERNLTKKWELGGDSDSGISSFKFSSQPQVRTTAVSPSCILYSDSINRIKPWTFNISKKRSVSHIPKLLPTHLELEKIASLRRILKGKLDMLLSRYASSSAKWRPEWRPSFLKELTMKAAQARAARQMERERKRSTAVQL